MYFYFPPCQIYTLLRVDRGQKPRMFVWRCESLAATNLTGLWISIFRYQLFPKGEYQASFNEISTVFFDSVEWKKKKK